MKPSCSMRLLLSLFIGCWAAGVAAEQKLSFDGYELHYVVIPTSFIAADIAQRYNLVRGSGRALVNVSLVKDGIGVAVDGLQGQVKNLLSQAQALDFEKVVEGDAIYYLAQLRHADRDTLIFTLEVTAPGLSARQLSFQQEMYAAGVTSSAQD